MPNLELYKKIVCADTRYSFYTRIAAYDFAYYPHSYS